MGGGPISLAVTPAKDTSSKVKVYVPEPSPFDDIQSSKELKNFLWDMEQFFCAAYVPEADMVQVCLAYLTATPSCSGGPRLPL